MSISGEEEAYLTGWVSQAANRAAVANSMKIFLMIFWV
jgi:hypothetical protein